MSIIKSSQITPAHIEELLYAKQLLENPGLAAKITNFIGSPLEVGFKMLPSDWREKIGEITTNTLLKMTEGAVATLDENVARKPTNLFHKLGVAVSGGVGGFFGLAGLAVELPVSTGIMLRSINDIARSQGELITSTETKLACLEVFALGGNQEGDDSSDQGYYIVRGALSKPISETAEFIAKKGLVGEGSPIILRFVSNIAQRFGIQITEKAAAQALPVIGAAGGAVINTLFMDHFQDMAEGHFIVRRLERVYGKNEVKALYTAL